MVQVFLHPNLTAPEVQTSVNQIKETTYHDQVGGEAI